MVYRVLVVMGSVPASVKGQCAQINTLKVNCVGNVLFKYFYLFICFRCLPPHQAKHFLLMYNKIWFLTLRR